MITSAEEKGLSTSAVRWAGLAAMLGGSLYVVSAVVN
jgi:hypothetical protein